MFLSSSYLLLEHREDISYWVPMSSLGAWSCAEYFAALLPSSWPACRGDNIIPIFSARNLKHREIKSLAPGLTGSNLGQRIILLFQRHFGLFSKSRIMLKSLVSRPWWQMKTEWDSSMCTSIVTRMLCPGRSSIDMSHTAEQSSPGNTLSCCSATNPNSFWL